MKAWGGVFGAILLLVVMAGLLSMTTSVQPAQPDELLPGWLFLATLVGGGLFVVMCWGGRINLFGLLVAAVVVAALMLLNSTDAMPGVDNPCPDDEVVIAIDGHCYGMDTDANRAALDRMVQP